MALVNAYATVQQLRDQLGDSDTRLDTDSLIRALNAVSRSIDDYTGQRFWRDETPTVRSYRPSEPDVAWVAPISTTTDGLVVETRAGAGWEEWALEDDFELYPDADGPQAAHAWWRIEAIGCRFPISRRRSLRVTARHGWSAVPVEVEQACLIKAASLFLRKSSPYGHQSFDQFGTAIRITRRDPHVQELLGDFIRMETGAV